MLEAVARAMALYGVLVWLLHPLGNHGLWAAFTLFFVTRAIAQFFVMPGRLRRSFSAS